MPRVARMPIHNAEEVAGNLRAAARRFNVRGQHRNSSICEDMAMSVAAYGGWASTAQRDYAMSLIRRSQEEPPSPTVGAATVAPETVDMANATRRIRALFETATRHGIQRPAIHLSGLRFAMASPHSQHAGSIYITSNERLRSQRRYFGRIGALFETATRHGIQRPAIHLSNERLRSQRRYFGRIAQTGAFHPAVTCPAESLEQIRAFGENPSGIARAHGQATGICCFCRHPLTDARSVAMGYGPICADHYGLEWGEQRASGVVEIPVGEANDQSPAPSTFIGMDFGSPSENPYPPMPAPIRVVTSAEVSPEVRATMREVDAQPELERREDAYARAARILREARVRADARRREAELRRRRLQETAERANAANTRLVRDFVAAAPARLLPDDDEDSHFMTPN